MISTTEVLNHADVLMRERYLEPIRSRQIKVIVEAIVCAINDQARQSKGSAEQQSGEAPVQQLKAEIAALVREYDVAGSQRYSLDNFDRVIERMRQLSAV